MLDQKLCNGIYEAKFSDYIGFQCSYCENILTEENLTRDHVIPVSEKLKCHDNVTPCCIECNQKKGSTSLLVFMGLINGRIKKKSHFWKLDEKSKKLTEICGLEVKALKIKKDIEYGFYIDGKQVKSCFTYPKAKLFAEGYALGIKYGKL